jgi:hypothetical protein
VPQRRPAGHSGLLSGRADGRTAVRTCVSAIQTTEELDFALDVLARAGRRTGLID